MLKPGGRLLITDYCRGEGEEASDGFRTYVDNRKYDLRTVPVGGWRPWLGALAPLQRHFLRLLAYKWGQLLPLGAAPHEWQQAAQAKATLRHGDAAGRAWKAWRTTRHCLHLLRVVCHAELLPHPRTAPGPQEYASLLKAAGFVDVMGIDRTQQACRGTAQQGRKGGAGVGRGWHGLAACPLAGHCAHATAWGWGPVDRCIARSVHSSVQASGRKGAEGGCCPCRCSLRTA